MSQRFEFRRLSRLLAFSLLALGVSPALLALANCQPTLVSPAICEAAHASPPPPQSGIAYCRLDSMDNCVPSPNSLCVSRYGIGVAGKCIFKLDYAHPTSCTKDYGVTVIDLPRYNASCTAASGDCQCEYSVDSMSNSTQVEVCDCVQQNL